MDNSLIDKTPVKSLKILAQICVDELEKCNKNEMQTKSPSNENDNSIYISSDSESDTSSTRSSQRGVITGGIRKPSFSGSGSSSENESSSDSSSSSDSDSDDDDDNDDEDDDDDNDDVDEKEEIEKEKANKNKNRELVETKETPKISNENKNMKIDVQQIVDEWSSDSNTCEESPLKVTKSVEESAIAHSNETAIENKIETEIANENRIETEIANENTNEISNGIAIENKIETEISDENKIEIEITNDISTIVTENEVNVVYNPSSLKEISKEVLRAHSMVLRYEVPSLRYLCEHTMVTNGMEIPLICFVQEEQYEYISAEQPSNDDEGVYLCVDSEFDETELANLFNGGGNGLYESVGNDATETDECASDKASLIDQCVALQNILSSPQPEDSQLTPPIDMLSNETEYYMDPNGFHDSIQYEETVLPSDNNIEDSAIATAKLKKFLQKKYVHPLCYHKMFAINKLLRKYKVHQVSFCSKKSTVQQHLQKTILKMRQKAKQRCKPKKFATRRSARIADKIKQQHESDEKVYEKPIKLIKLNKSTKSDNGKNEATENRRFCKIMNVNDLIQNSGNKKKISETDKESITRDILKLIAQKRTLKRKLSICQRPNFSVDDDGYCYDEDGQISEMLSSFINNSFDEPRVDSLNAKKPGSRKSSIDNQALKEPDNKKKKVPPITLKKQVIAEDKGKLKKSHSKEKNPKKETATTTAAATFNPQESSLPPTEAYAINKTEKKNTFLGTTLTFPTKASVKEVIPAKRTRFLSIDGSFMRYGAETKRSYNQMKSLKENSESPEFGRGKISAQRLSKTTTTADVVKTKKSIPKMKRIKEKNGNVGEIQKPDELKQLQSKLAKKSIQSQKCENVKVPLKLAIKQNSETKKLHASKQPIVIKKIESQMAKIIQEPIVHSATECTEALKQRRHSDIIQTTTTKILLKAAANSIEQIDSSRVNSTENNIDSLNTVPPVKLTIKKLDKPLSERRLCSTMVSPLKIIIEPKRLQSQQSVKERIFAQDPLTINTNHEPNARDGKPSNEQQPIVEKKEVHRGRPTRFSERITSLVENPLPTPEYQVNKSISIQNETVKMDENKKIEEKSPFSSHMVAGARDIVDKNIIHVSTVKPTSTTTFMNTDSNASIKPYLDIETLLPSTRILQVKPAKRCLARAQTISHSEPTFRSVEPMRLRSSNFSRNQRRSSPSNEPTTRWSAPFKSIEKPFTIPKRKITPNAISPPRISSSPKIQRAPLQRTPIDVSSFPDPDSLEIPSIDLRSSSLCSSPLTLPIAMPMPMPKPKSNPQPAPKTAPSITIPMCMPPSNVHKETAKGKSTISFIIFI